MTKGLNTFDVTEEDVAAYLHYKGLLGGNKEWGVIEPITHNNRTTCYIISSRDSWEIISADKRGPIVLLCGDGQYSAESLSESSSVWLYLLIDDLEYRWYKSDEYYAALDANGLRNEQACQDFWSSVCCETDFLSRNGAECPVTKAGEITGHYEMTNSWTELEDYEVVDHLISTHWKQTDPFNAYCPLKNGSTTERCPAGCVTIAGAQVMKYFHDSIGTPQYAPSSGYCIGNESNYSMGFPTMSDTVWTYMQNLTDLYGYGALFVGAVAAGAGISFSSNGSGASVEDLIDFVFEPNGLTATYTNSYNKDIVYNDLREGRPVIMEGYRYEDLFSWPGHAFIIDGYKTSVIRYYFLYEWVYDVPTDPTMLLPAPLHPYTTSYTGELILEYFKLNWGHGDLDADSLNYSTNGNWQYGNLNPYQYSRKITHNIRPYEN